MLIAGSLPPVLWALTAWSPVMTVLLDTLAATVERESLYTRHSLGPSLSKLLQQ
jgi:hypothetical protein